MRTKRSFIAIFLVVILANHSGAQPGSVIRRAVGSVVRTATGIATAPTQAIVNAGLATVGISNPAQIYTPFQEVAKSGGETVNVAAQAFFIDPQSFLYQKARSFAAVGGTPGKFVFDVATFTTKSINDLTGAGATNIGTAVQRQNPLQITAAPLAAAIRAAKDAHAEDAKPIPTDVRTALRGYFSETTLARAKYAVGSVEITLPNFIGRGAKLFGNDYAVVVDDIIVFNTEPPSYSQGAFWWAHEMTHVQQYEAMGIEVFAYEYQLRHQRFEDEADANARRVTGDSSKVGRSQLKIGSYDMSGYNDPNNYQANPETFVAQAVFSAEKRPFNYLVTNYGRVIAVDPLKGDWSHIGYAVPSVTPGAAWDYKTEKERYAVYPGGTIFSPASDGDSRGTQMGMLRLLSTAGEKYSPSDPTIKFFNTSENPNNLVVTRTYVGGAYHLKVDLKLPLTGFQPGQQFERISVYGFRVTAFGRSDAPPNIFPTIPGNWKPGEKVSFEFNVPYEFSDAANGFQVRFCIGSTAGCLPSPNLLIGTR